MYLLHNNVVLSPTLLNQPEKAPKQIRGYQNIGTHLIAHTCQPAKNTFSRGQSMNAASKTIQCLALAWEYAHNTLLIFIKPLTLIVYFSALIWNVHWTHFLFCGVFIIDGVPFGCGEDAAEPRINVQIVQSRGGECHNCHFSPEYYKILQNINNIGHDTLIPWHISTHGQHNSFQDGHRQSWSISNLKFWIKVDYVKQTQFEVALSVEWK